MEFKGQMLSNCVFFLSLFVYFSVGHPQCLDSRPPFQSDAALEFCANQNYSDFGCCTVNDDRVLRVHYANLESRLMIDQPNLWNMCKDYTKTFLCQACSPYAAHIFDSEVSQVGATVMPRKFPGLCGSLCSDFYRSCRDLVQYYMDEMGSSQEEKARVASATSEAAFCSAVSLTDMDYCYPLLLTNPVLNGNISIERVTKEGCICVEPITKSGEMLRNPIFLEHAGDGSNRLFVGEQIGLVHVFYPNGTRLLEPFLDIQYKIHTTSYKGDERGMLGMTFHPKFKENGKFYMYYSTPLKDHEYGLGDHKIIIEELRVSSTDPNKADPSTGKIILEVVEPFWNHNGGELLFGDDGFLYIFVGDGGKAGDTLRAGQNLTTFLGKVLRVDVDVASSYPKPYKIPADNPFADGQLGLPEIYAYGVRNIWRCGKDRGDPITGVGKGRIVCGDVGQSAREELDLLEKGANYGWNLREGRADYCPKCPRGLPNISLTEPIHDYPHTVGKSVTGGHFYRGCQSPNLNGFYIYGDFMSGKLFRLLHDESTGAWNNRELNMCGSDRCTPPLENDYSTSIISFGEDEDGEIYMLSTSLASTTVYEGSIYKIVDPSRRGNPANCQSTPQSTMAPMTTTQRDTSAGVIPLFDGSQTRMSNYLDYFKQRSHQKQRRKSRKKWQQRQQLQDFRNTSRQPFNAFRDISKQQQPQTNQHLPDQARMDQRRNNQQPIDFRDSSQQVPRNNQGLDQGQAERGNRHQTPKRQQSWGQWAAAHWRNNQLRADIERNPQQLQAAESNNENNRFRGRDQQHAPLVKSSTQKTPVGRLTYHGIHVRRCSSFPKVWCDLNRFTKQGRQD